MGGAAEHGHQLLFNGLRGSVGRRVLLLEGGEVLCDRLQRQLLELRDDYPEPNRQIDQRPPQRPGR
jgi:hypothetical protein